MTLKYPKSITNQHDMAQIPTRRKTRIVCISDTHNQTPKLPPGDVLIHAGDLTNQGSYSELKRTMEWLGKTDFEVKIIVAGNHEITLDQPFFKEYESKWKWPEPQDSSECRRLVVEAQGITYLEHEAVTVRLRSGVQFKVFGSPFSPGQRGWAFQYQDDGAESLWSQIPKDADIVVTHAPPRGHCDTTVHDKTEAGCPELLKRLADVQPVLSVCGHIHEGRGAKHVCWRHGTSRHWEDPGAGNKKLSLVGLTKKGRRRVESCTLTGQNSVGPTTLNGATTHVFNDQDSAATFGRCTLNESEIGSCASGQQCHLQADLECREGGNKETTIVNASVLGPKSHRSHGINKPIVVDIDFPVLEE
jgi:Icc-related predicted phosphoesterase